MKLRAENIQKSYKGRRVVKGVSIEVNQGEIVGLLGPNGAGKTTSFYMIVGLIRPNEGKVYLDEKEITGAAMYKRAQMGIGYLPQEVSVFRKMSIEDNIMSVLEMTDLKKDERQAKLETLLDEFGLQHVRKNLGQSLSGGEKRRTEIARALATDPKFILLDEPFAGVDPIAVEDIQKIVAKLKQKNIGVLITDHNVQETLSITDRTYLLFEGSILRSGTAEELAADPQVRKVYLGRNFVLRKIDPEVSKAAEVYGEDITADDLSSEKNVAYIDNIINQAKSTLGRVKSQSWLFPNPNYGEETGVDHLITLVKDLKEFFLVYDFGSRGMELYNVLNFGPLKKYSRSTLGLGIDQYAVFIPFAGWYVTFLHFKRRKRCEDDIAQLVTNLESLKMLVENPELEDML